MQTLPPPTNHPDSNNDDAVPNAPYPKKRSRFLIYLISAIIIILLIISASIFHYMATLAAAKRAGQKHPLPIVVATAYSSEVPVYLFALGTVTPTYTVTIKTQVNGTLLRVLYREGQTVKAGQLLAEIDPRPFLAQLSQFEGQLARDTAQLTNAEVDLKRYKKLYPQGAISQQVYATQAALVNELEGTVKFDQGQIDTVKVNLIYTKIISPIAGRVGLRLVDPGNLVQTTDTNGLVVVNTIQPITVVFAIPEDAIPQVMKQLTAGHILPVKAYDRAQNQLLATGVLLTLDNQISTTTGTVNLKAQFANEDLQLFPNQFVNIGLLVNTLHNTTVVPTTAVQHGTQNTFVYVVNKNNTVSLRPIQTGITAGEITTIKSGIQPNEHVVVEGADKLTDGAPIRVANATNLATTRHGTAF